MSKQIEICFNPYTNLTQILIDGKSLSEYSSLIQYMNEPLYKWYENLFELLYSETNEKYSLTFIGRKMDADILKQFAAECEYCVSFSALPFPIDTPLQKRLIKLNSIIKSNDINVNRINVNIDFVKQSSKFDDYLEEINIKNRFCIVKKNVYVPSEYNLCSKKSKYLFALCNTFDFINEINLDAEYIFVIKVGDKESNITYKRGIVYIEINETKLYDTLFDFILYSPLCDAFIECMNEIQQNESITMDDEYRKLSAIKPIVKVDIPEVIELNRSERIKVYTDPVGEIPNVRFEYDYSGIVKCNNLIAEGLSEGIVNVFVFESGMNKPFVKKEIHVIKRNRITNILFQDEKILLGENDKKRIDISFLPEDADNADSIEWTSTDNEIAAVSKDGVITALKEGHCQIICSAENVSSRFDLFVKPYLTHFNVDNISSEDIELYMGTELNLSIVPIPENAIDNTFSISSSDTLIVNTFGTILHPVSLGEVRILIINSSKRIKKFINVKVINTPKAEKKHFWNIFKNKRSK